MQQQRGLQSHVLRRLESKKDEMLPDLELRAIREGIRRSRSQWVVQRPVVAFHVSTAPPCSILQLAETSWSGLIDRSIRAVGTLSAILLFALRIGLSLS